VTKTFVTVLSKAQAIHNKNEGPSTYIMDIV
jgi:hypothetical protein